MATAKFVGREPLVAKNTIELTAGVFEVHPIVDELLVKLIDAALTVAVVAKVTPPGVLPDHPAPIVTVPGFAAVVPLITRIAQF